MSASYDVVTIGGGANGLTAAAYLARQGRRVLLVERRDVLGGTAAAEVFHPGFRSPGLHHDTTAVRGWIVEELGLERHGLGRREHPAEVWALGNGGPPLPLYGEPRSTASRIGAISGRDGEAYERFWHFIEHVRGSVAPFFDEPPLDWIRPERSGWMRLLRHGLRLRRLGRRDALELLRLPPMSVADWLAEWFDSEPLSAALALPALVGTKVGPRAPGSNANLLLHACAAGGSIEGGAPALVRALERAARAHGVEIRTAATVRRVLTDALGVAGIEIEGGERVAARTVVSSCDPRRTLLDLLPAGVLSHRLGQRMAHYRTDGTTAQVLLALDGPPQVAGVAGLEFARTGACMDDLERARDAVKYRALPGEPVLDLHVGSAATSGDDGSAPPGGAVVSALVHFAPYALARGWDDAARGALADSVVHVLARHVPGIAGSIVGRLVLAPPDIEARYGISGGHLFHGELALDQLLVRPAPECLGYGTPVPGLWIAGSGSHPGFGLTCAPGAHAAAAILRKSGRRRGPIRDRPTRTAARA